MPDAGRDDLLAGMWRGWFLLLSVAGGDAALAEPSRTPEEMRQIAAETLDRLLEEDEQPYASKDERSSTVALRTHTRPSGSPGVCEWDVVTIHAVSDQTSAAIPRPARISEVESSRRFHILASGDGKARWELSGPDLTKSCEAAGLGKRGIEADHVSDAVNAVHGLLAVERELARPDSPRLEIECGERRRCLDRERMLALIDPLAPTVVRQLSGQRSCPKGGYCLETRVVDLSFCGSWIIRLEMDGAQNSVLRRARFLRRPEGFIHCFGEES